MTIQRLAGQARGRSRATVHNGLVYAVATDPSSSKTVAEQTLRTLEELEKTLIEAGSGKDKILQATVYLREMASNAEMDAVWCAWIGPEKNWPQRACVGTNLAENDRVEIVLVAAVA